MLVDSNLRIPMPTYKTLDSNTILLRRTSPQRALRLPLMVNLDQQPQMRSTFKVKMEANMASSSNMATASRAARRPTWSASTA